MIPVIFQPFLDLFKPQGLKPHQLRPQDMHELLDNALDKKNPILPGPTATTFDNNGYNAGAADAKDFGMHGDDVITGEDGGVHL